MSFITKNANVILLFLIVFASVGLAGSTVFFQDRLDDINFRYEEKLDELNRIQSDLQNKEKELGAVLDEIELKRTREQELTGKFIEKEEALETTAAELSSVQKQNELLETERSKLRRDIQALEAENAELELTVEDLESDKASLENRVENLEDDLDSCEEDLDACLNP